MRNEPQRDKKEGRSKQPGPSLRKPEKYFDIEFTTSIQAGRDFRRRMSLKDGGQTTLAYHGSIKMKGIYWRVLFACLVVQGALVSAATGAPVDELRVSDACANDKTQCTAEERRKLAILARCIDRPDLCDPKKSRLTAYQPNYAIFQNTNNDERSIEVHYSFKYSFTKPHCMPLKKSTGSDAYPDIDCLSNYDRRWETFFTYTGEFDFYMGTRDSSPVINRISNPAFHYRKHLGDSFSGNAMSLEWLNVAIEHRSDGQVIEADEKITDPASPDFGRYRAQVELEKGNHQYFDAISRGANYFSFEGKLNIGKSHGEYKACNETLGCVNTWVSAKLYFTKDSNVYWGPQVNKGVTISDYDRFRFVIANTFNT